jgi:drug/metabolite transporter (DMT)-like permease
VTTALAGTRPRTAGELGLIAASIAVFFWGLGPVFVRAMGVSAPTVIVYRFALGTPAIVGVSLALGARFSRGLFRQALMPGALFGVTLIVGFEAVKNTSVANATLINNLLPVLVVLVARFLYNERIRGRQYVAVAASLVGIVVVVAGAGSSGEAGLWGDFLALVSLLLWTVYFLRAKRMRDTGVDSWSLIATITVVAAAVAVPPCLLIADDLGAVQGNDWWFLIAMVLGPGVLGHGLMTWAARHLEVTVAALMTLASPVVSAVAAWLWLDQRMTGVQALGASIVLVSLAAITLNARVESVRAAALSDAPE